MSAHIPAVSFTYAAILCFRSHLYVRQQFVFPKLSLRLAAACVSRGGWYVRRLVSPTLSLRTQFMLCRAVVTFVQS